MKTEKIIAKLFILLIVVLFINGCQKDEEKKIDFLNGFVQKGPFINGSSVTVFDLNSDLSATGLTYNAQINDNDGSFEMNNITLNSDYTSLRADGFYFNEISGKQSAAQITLYALADISDQTTINVNILTHLEKARVEFLLKSGEDFAASKLQAEKEILAIFNIEKEDIKNFESLTISDSGDDNGILLALTAILQGYRSESEVTELMAAISNDIKEDGTLDDSSLGSELINHAVYLDTTAISENLSQRYQAIGSTATIPSFGKYITNFIEKTSYPITSSLIDYPEEGLYGTNILYPSVTEITSGSNNNTYSLAAIIPDDMSLKIRISTVGFPEKTNLWYYMGGSENNWSITIFDFSTYKQTFTAVESGRSCDLNMIFNVGTILIEYFETNSDTPTRTKTVTIK